MAIRRAALRRERPSRGQYGPGEWVMVWKNRENKSGMGRTRMCDSSGSAKQGLLSTYEQPLESRARAYQTSQRCGSQNYS